jgi:hypothetical protein
LAPAEFESLICRKGNKKMGLVGIEGHFKPPVFFSPFGK